MIGRRRFLQSLIAAAASPATAAPAGTDYPLLGPLRPDPKGVLDLPDGFGYQVVSHVGATMNDALQELARGAPAGRLLPFDELREVVGFDDYDAALERFRESSDAE